MNVGGWCWFGFWNCYVMILCLLLCGECVCVMGIVLV